MIRTMMLLHDGSSIMVKMDPAMFEQLATSIAENGREVTRLGNGAILTVVGFIVIGNQTGERVIVLPEAPESDE